MTRLARSIWSGNSLRPSATCIAVIVVVILHLASLPVAQAAPRRIGSREPANRRYAEPPKFDRRVRDIFFPDAREVLGERSATSLTPPSASATVPTQPTAPNTPRPNTLATDAPSTVAWSEVISAAALESAVKQINQRLSDVLARPGRFKTRDSFRQVQGDFTLLAVLLGVVAEYDTEIRWHDRAGAVRDAVAGADWQEATNEAYSDAKRRHELLETLLRGENLDLPEAVDVKTWADVADRRLLMSRTELTLEESIAAKLDGPRMTTPARDSLAREAQLIALAARVFQDEGYEFGDDGAFREYAQAMESAATELRRAIESGDQPAAREALDHLRQTCAVCHEDYRISDN